MRTFPTLSYILTLSALLLTACSPTPEKNTQSKIEELQKKIEAQNSELSLFEKNTTSLLETRANSIALLMSGSFSNFSSSVNLSIANLNQKVYGLKSAVLDPSAKGYSYINTDTGIFLFSVDDVTPFLDGHKITLRIGNPMYATYTNFKLRVLNGRRPPLMPTEDMSKSYAENQEANQKWWKDRQDWEKSVHTQDISFTDTLEPGSWNKVNFTLADTKPEDVAYLEIAIFTDTISLRKPLSNLK